MNPLKKIILLSTLMLSTQAYATMYENAEDESSSRWQVYDNTPAGATIDNVYSSQRDNNAIEFIGAGTSNGYMLGNLEKRKGAWNNTKEHTLQWKMNFTKGVVVYVRVMTQQGARYLYYTNSSKSYGKRNNTYIHMGLGKKASDGAWHAFTRDLEADLKKYEPNNQLIAVNAFLVRGNGFVDDVELVSKTMNPNKIDTISAQNTEATLTLSMNGAFEKGSHGSFFIDADNDSSTGYSADTVRGADYLVQGTALYQYNGDGNSWKWDKRSSSVHSTQTLNTITSVIPLNMMDIVGDSIKYIASISLPNWKYRKNYTEMVEHQMVGDNNPSVIIGARPVASTPLKKGKLFVSPNGGGDICTENNPCNIYTAFNKIKAGDVVFLRGGEYHLSKKLIKNTAFLKTSLNKQIIIESYPNEKAILVGDATIDKIKKEQCASGGFSFYERNKNNHFVYINIRNIEMKNMGGRGISIKNINGVSIEGCNIHHNFGSGIVLVNSDENTIKNNTIYSNSDVGIKGKYQNVTFDDGGNSDGIQIPFDAPSSNNIISHNTVSSNSDDGIDLIGGINTTVNYNLVYENAGIDGGEAENGGTGNGIGIKGCGENARGTHLEHNIAFGNKGNGFECNVNNGEGVVFQYNTSYNNRNYGFEISTGNSVAKVLKNISSENNNSEIDKNVDTIDNSVDNSWDRGGQVRFISTDPHSPNFLKPVKGSGFEDIGAYANMGDNENNQVKIFVIGDSTTYAKGEFFDNAKKFPKMGWSEKEALGSYMLNPNNLYPRGRSGASSKSYHTYSNDWDETKNLIKNTNISNGAYLLIQFGHNDEHAYPDTYETSPDEFYDELAFYVDWAKENHIIPVLVTPVERRQKSAGNDNHQTHKEDLYYGNYQQVVKNVAKDKGIVLLDLQYKSWNEYNKDMNADNKSLNAIFANENSDDTTHFSPKGAKEVAGWVKELICQSNAQRLCAEFK